MAGGSRYLFSAIVAVAGIDRPTYPAVSAIPVAGVQDCITFFCIAVDQFTWVGLVALGARYYADLGCRWRRRRWLPCPKQIPVFGLERQALGGRGLRLQDSFQRGGFCYRAGATVFQHGSQVADGGVAVAFQGLE